jgi:CBS domain containing-hemolysin-like protein
MFAHLQNYSTFINKKHAGKGGELTHDETTIIAGALELSEKKAKDAMTPLFETFVIDINAKLDRYWICLKSERKFD